MKRLNALLVVAVLITVVSVGYCGTVDPPYEVGTWQGFSTAAVSYTFDDNLPNQLAIAVPMFDEFGFKLTLYTVTGSGWYAPANWTGLQAAAANGHEIGSHTVTHPSLNTKTIEVQTTELVDSQNTINSYIEPNQCFTIAYPNCNPSDAALTATYYIAGRTCSGQIVPSTPSNFLQISSVICGNQGVNTTSAFITKFTSAASSGGWFVPLLHAVDGDNGYSPLSSTILRESLEYLDEHRSTYWVSSFSNVVRYIKERNDVSVTQTSSTDASITIQVTDTLDNAIFSFPITIRRPLPENWLGVNVMQNGQPLDSNIVTVGETTYIMFDVIPDTGDVTLLKELDAPTGLEAAADINTVTLDWNDNAESTLAGYNAYRATAADSNLVKLNSSLITASDYNDVNVPLDTTYHYAVTAVDSNSYESDFSNEAIVFGGPFGDFTGNLYLDLNDLSVFLNYWLLNNCDQTSGVDLDDNCNVNFIEFSTLANDWM